MAEPTLTVKNITTSAVELELPDGTLRSFAAGEEVALEQAVLESAPLAERIIEAKLKLLTPALSTLSAEEKTLGRVAVVALVRALSGRVLGTERAFKDAKANLVVTRALYNTYYGVTKPLLEAAKTISAGAKNLVEAANHFVNTDELEAAVAVVEAAIAAKEAEDLVALNKSLTDWYAEREALQADLELAQGALVFAQSDFQARWQPLFESLDTAATDMSAVNPNTDIKDPIPAFP